MRLKRVVVSTDGEPGSDAALQVASRLAERDDGFVEIVSVFTPRTPIPQPDGGRGEVCCEPRDRLAAAEQFSRVWRQARERLHLAWPITYRVGFAPRIVAELARSGGADLIVITRSPEIDCNMYSPGARATEQIAFASDSPILALPRRAGDQLPRVAVVALDDSTASRHASLLARSVLARHGVLHSAKRAASPELLALCDALGAELLAIPLPGDSPVVRSLMGGPVAALLSHARCAVLVAPSVPAPRTGATPTPPCTYEVGKGLEIESAALPS